MAGYSGTPLPKKLGIGESMTVLLLGAPNDFPSTLGQLPDGVGLVTKPQPADVVIMFATSESQLRERFADAKDQIGPTGAIWVAWPKKASGVETELTFDVVQPHGLAAGLVDNKVCAIDEVWSGLRFVVRREDRAAWPKLG